MGTVIVNLELTIRHLSLQKVETQNDSGDDVESNPFTRRSISKFGHDGYVVLMW